jgi:hypothetical protein
MSHVEPGTRTRRNRSGIETGIETWSETERASARRSRSRAATGGLAVSLVCAGALPVQAQQDGPQLFRFLSLGASKGEDEPDAYLDQLYGPGGGVLSDAQGATVTGAAPGTRLASSAGSACTPSRVETIDLSMFLSERWPSGRRRRS